MKNFFFFFFFSLNSFLVLAQDPCTVGCPNYPCCIKLGVQCDDTPCKSTTTTTTVPSTNGGALVFGDINYRPVYWIHGMEGSNKAWNVYYKKYTDEYKIYSSVADYTSADGADTGAEEVKKENIEPLKAKKTNLNNAFVISHSMGGIITRVLDKDPTTTDAFGGFVTFSSPHEGTGLANAALDNTANGIKAWLYQGVSDVLEGPTLGIYRPSVLGYAAHDLISGYVKGKAVDATFKTWASDKALNSLKENGPFLSTLNATPTNGKPKVVFAAVEDGPTLWREVTSFLPYIAPSELPLNIEIDGLIPTVIEGLKGIYEFNHTLNRTAMFLNPFAVRHHASLSNAWLKGYKWLAESNGQWQVYLNSVGSVSTETFMSSTIEKRKICGYKIKDTQVTVTIRKSGENDGIVKKSSSLGLPDKTEDRVLPGVNHQQCVNSKESTNTLDDLFNGGINDFFKTNPK